MTQYIGSLDAGKGAAKLTLSECRRGIPIQKKPGTALVTTRITEVGFDENIEISNKSFDTQFEGCRYIVGEEGKTSNTELTKTLLIHKLSGYVAITRLIKSGKKVHDITLVLACPLLTVKYTEPKQEYLEFMTNDGKPVKIIVNGEEFNFRFTNILLKSEAFGVKFYVENDNNGIFLKKDVTVVDLGRLNLTCLNIVDGKVNLSNREHFDLGYNYLLNKVQAKLSAYLKQTLAIEKAERALNNGCYLSEEKHPESVKIISDAKIEYINDIVRNLESKSIFFNQSDYSVFIGGTVNVIHDDLLNHPKIKDNFFTYKDPQMASVMGLYELSKIFAKKMYTEQKGHE